MAMQSRELLSEEERKIHIELTTTNMWSDSSFQINNSQDLKVLNSYLKKMDLPPTIPSPPANQEINYGTITPAQLRKVNKLANQTLQQRKELEYLVSAQQKHLAELKAMKQIRLFFMPSFKLNTENLAVLGEVIQQINRIQSNVKIILNFESDNRLKDNFLEMLNKNAATNIKIRFRNKSVSNTTQIINNLLDPKLNSSITSIRYQNFKNDDDFKNPFNANIVPSKHKRGDRIVRDVLRYAKMGALAPLMFLGYSMYTGMGELLFVGAGLGLAAAIVSWPASIAGLIIAGAVLGGIMLVSTLIGVGVGLHHALSKDNRVKFVPAIADADIPNTTLSIAPPMEKVDVGPQVDPLLPDNSRSSSAVIEEFKSPSSFNV